jgi:hypothetical protein
MHVIEFLLQGRRTDAKVMNVKTLGLSSASLKLPAIHFCFDFYHSACHFLPFYHTLLLLSFSSTIPGNGVFPEHRSFSFFHSKYKQNRYQKKGLLLQGDRKMDELQHQTNFGQDSQAMDIGKGKLKSSILTT